MDKLSERQRYMQNMFTENKIQILKVKIQAKNKQIIERKKNIHNINQDLKHILLKREGLEYEIEIYNHKKRDRNRKGKETKEFKEQVRDKEKKITELDLEIKEKQTALTYIEKWTRNLQKQFEEIRNKHKKNK